MLSYILKVTLCWSLFYLLYHLWLGKETFFKINRWYLMGTALLGLIIPTNDFQLLLPVQEEPMIVTYLQPISVGVDQLETAIVTASAEKTSINWWGILMNIYWLGVAIAFGRFLYGLSRINRLYNIGQKSFFNGYQFILTSKMHVPFSFFKNLFWSKNFEVNESDKQNILRHEEAHIFQWHSIDVIFFEILAVLFWCSPFIYFYKKAIKNTHEYLADDYVVAQASRKQYGRLLLRQSKSMVPIAISNSFFSSQLKNRIVMITKNRSTKTASLKYLAGIPLLAMLFLAFSFQQKPLGQEQQRIHPVYNSQVETDSLPKGEIFKVVEEMPTFKGCESITDQLERKKCADEKMLQFIYANLKYPEEAKEKSIEGMVITSFIIEKDGSISNAKIVRAIGGGCDEEVLRVVNAMPNWQPGKQRGQVVRVQFNLPVRFKLDDKQEEEPQIPAVGTDQSEEVFKVVEEMPRFPGCEEIADEAERTSCWQTKMLEFIYTNIKYPEAARKNGIEGMSVVKFIVEKDGSISEAAIARPIGGECDEEVLKVVYMMPNWIPGKQRGKVVRTQFMLPVKFKLEGEDNQETTAYDEVDEMPVMASCAEAKGEERTKCSNMALIHAVYSQIKYPKAAKEKNVEGTVYAKFVVDENGSVTKVVVDKPLGSGCDEEVKRVLNEMPKWIPGKKDGKPVAVQMVIPVKFALSGSDATINVQPNVNQKPSSVKQVIKAFPNPTSDKLSMEINLQPGNYELKLLDQTGKEIHSKDLTNTDGKTINIIDFPVSGVARGTLYISIRDESGEVIQTTTVVLQ